MIQNLKMILMGGLRLLPLYGGIAILIIVIQYFNFRKLKNQFLNCIVRKTTVKEMGVREPTKARPYYHSYVICNFSNGKDLVEIPYAKGDLEHTQEGDEISVYFYPNGMVTVVAFDEETTKKKFRQHVLMILVACVVVAFLIPVVGRILMYRIPK